jgi:hypothetical protein
MAPIYRVAEQAPIVLKPGVMGGVDVAMVPTDGRAFMVIGKGNAFRCACTAVIRTPWL